MPDAAERLLELAHDSFCSLSLAEREVLRCATAGEEADLAQWGPTPAEGEEREPGGGPLRSAVLEWLCTDARAKRLVHRKGVRIKNATLDKTLDLEFADVPFLFALHSCRLPGLNAAHTRFGDSLVLKRCRIDGLLDLIGARIGGQLLCNSAHILGAEGVAIQADGAGIGSDVSLSDEFQATGEVRLLGAKIAGQLNCTDGTFLNCKQKALSADSTDIGGNVLLSKGFRAEGEVRLLGAKITGQLDCTGGRFLNHEGNALTLECASINDTLFLEPRRVRGTIDLVRTKIETGLRMTAESTAAATLDLRGAEIGDLFDSRKSWPEAGKLLLDGFRYDDIDHKSPRRAIERLKWLKLMPNGQFLPQPYEQLADWFRKTGHDSEAKDIRIAKEKARTQQWLNPLNRAYWRTLGDKWQGRTDDIEKDGTKTPNPAAKPWELFLKEPLKCLWWRLKWLTIGYGYRPQRAIYGLALLILFGWGVFALGHKGMTRSISYNVNATDTSNFTATLVASDYPKFRPFVYSMDVALPIVDLQQERYWMPNYHHDGPDVPFWEKGWWLWGVNWFEILAGWGLASMGIAGVTGIIHKD